MSATELFLPAIAPSPELPRIIEPSLPGEPEQLAPWRGDKIEDAVQRACVLAGEPASKLAAQVRAEVEFRLREDRPSLLHHEDLCALIEDLLIELAYPKVALAHARERARRIALREAELLRQIPRAEQPELVPHELLADVRARVSFARLGLELVLKEEQLVERLLRSVSLDLAEEERRDTIVLNAKTMLDLDADSRFFAGRILLTFIYEETLPWKVADGMARLKDAHRRAFLAYIPQGIELGLLDPRMAGLDLTKLAEALDPYADLQFDFLGLQTLYDRYLIHARTSVVDLRKRRLESPQIFWLRVAMGLALAEAEKERRTIEFYQVYRSRRACSSTPTLFNAGTRHSQLSSCYLLYCGDSIEDITETWRRFSMLSKWAGGLGCSWTAVRGTGAHIHGTNGESSGVIPFLKVSNDIALAVNQGGKRPGALCSYLELWHTDIEDFLDLRKETGDDRRRTHNMNTAHWIPDLFMKRLKGIADGVLAKDTVWTLFRSNETPDLAELYGRAFEERYKHYEAMVEEGVLFGKKVRILALWKRMLEALFETGHPWITFKDPCNIRSPQDHAGVIHNSNLCTEITLNTSMDEVAVCNLASIHLAEHLTPAGEIDHPKLRTTVSTVMRMLDNVIDLNFYPVDAARTSNMKHRPVGLGVMGLQDALYVKRIPFDSDDAVAFNDEIIEAVAYYAYEASSELARERGAYPSFKGSKWDRGLMPLDTLTLLERERGVSLRVDWSARFDWDVLRAKIRQHGMRNSNCLAIAPTATISNIMGSAPCIEPVYKHIHTKSNLSGDFIRTTDPLIRDLMALGLWDDALRAELKAHDGSIQQIDRVPDPLKRLYKTAFEIAPTWILQCAAVRQKWLDQAQSTNLWLADNDARAASFVYREAWERGLKTTYYLRTLNRSAMDSGHRESKRVEIVPGANAARREVCSIEAMRNGGVCEACQ
jgi:ribonucleoside-diphosphate reductase alpha chain